MAWILNRFKLVKDAASGQLEPVDLVELIGLFER